MAHSLSFLLSPEAATARMSERKPAFVVHLEVAPNTDAPMTELDADHRGHAAAIARHWLINGMAVSAGVRKVYRCGSLGEPDILDLSDFEDELYESTNANVNRVMAQYGLTF